MTCLDEAALIRVHFDDATADERAHVGGCTRCAAAVRALATDLGRVDVVLRQTTPSLRAQRSAMVLVLPGLVVAGLILALIVPRVMPLPASPPDAETVALVDELSGIFTSDDADDERLGDAPRATTTAASTCTWGDPLLGVGCDEPSATQIAWR